MSHFPRWGECSKSLALSGRYRGLRATGRCCDTIWGPPATPGARDRLTARGAGWAEPSCGRLRAGAPSRLPEAPRVGVARLPVSAQGKRGLQLPGGVRHRPPTLRSPAPFHRLIFVLPPVGAVYKTDLCTQGRWGKYQPSAGRVRHIQPTRCTPVPPLTLKLFNMLRA